jgi:hypothetical protein
MGNRPYRDRWLRGQAAGSRVVGARLPLGGAHNPFECSFCTSLLYKASLLSASLPTIRFASLRRGLLDEQNSIRNCCNACCCQPERLRDDR